MEQKQTERTEMNRKRDRNMDKKIENYCKIYFYAIHGEKQNCIKLSVERIVTEIFLDVINISEPFNKSCMEDKCQGFFYTSILLLQHYG